MNLRDLTRAVLAQVEQITGRPVAVNEDRGLRTLASVRMARGDAPAHVVSYNLAAILERRRLASHVWGPLTVLAAQHLVPETGLGFEPGGIHPCRQRC